MSEIGPLGGTLAVVRSVSRRTIDPPEFQSNAHAGGTFLHMLTHRDSDPQVAREPLCRPLRRARRLLWYRIWTWGRGWSGQCAGH